MTRRVSLPGASELFFRSTSSSTKEGAHRTESDKEPGVTESGRVPQDDEVSEPKRELSKTSKTRRGSPRKKHDAKITVYVSQEELLALEHARLKLRASHDLAVDRGRMVREAVAELLTDFEEHGDDSVLVQRLRMDGDPGSESGPR